jgi:hypothetical protein
MQGFRGRGNTRERPGVDSGGHGKEVRVLRIQVARALEPDDVLFADPFRVAAQAQGVSAAMSDDWVVESRPRTSSMYFLSSQ